MRRGDDARRRRRCFGSVCALITVLPGPPAAGRSRAVARLGRGMPEHGRSSGRRIRAEDYERIRRVRVGLAGGVEMGRLHRFAAVFTESTAAVSHCGPPFLLSFSGAVATLLPCYTR